MGSQGLNTLLKTSSKWFERTRSDFVFKSEMIKKKSVFFKPFYSFAANACDYRVKYIGYYDFRARLAHWKNVKRTSRSVYNNDVIAKFFFCVLSVLPVWRLSVLCFNCFTEVHVMAGLWSSVTVFRAIV